MTEETTNNLSLNTLSNPGTAQNRKRVGRGIGSGTGKTAGRGHKGQKSRSGGNVRPGFEGGQMPLQQRVPKFGFSSRTNNLLKEVNIKLLEGMTEVSLDTLKARKIISKKIEKVKIFGDTEITSKISVAGMRVTKGAKASIEKAGGSVADFVAPTPRPKFVKKVKKEEEVSE
tara:strand:- start:629 stop:1144 length:516 start_codon:yes stop_codon:yes gene_type:complete